MTKTSDTATAADGGPHSGAVPPLCRSSILPQARPMTEDCVRFVAALTEIETKMIQRRYSIGHNGAQRLLGRMVAAGAILPTDDPDTYKVLITPQDADTIITKLHSTQNIQ